MKQHQFVEELLKKMTVEEKVVQLSCIMPIRVTYGQEIKEEKLKEVCPNGVGRMTQFANTFIGGPKVAAKAYNTIQKYHVEKTRLGIPCLMQNEAAVGLVAADATILPTPVAMSSSFEPELVKKVYKVISDEAKAVGVRKCLSPVADVARDQRWGRVGETFGEDPTVVSAFSVAESKGLQGDYYGDHVISCAKHFMGYGASENGYNCAAINLGKKELREVHGTPFAAMIKENDLQAVMLTYSEIDGLPLIVNNKYVNEYLRGDLGFTGSAICDGTGIPWVLNMNGIGKDKADIARRAALNGVDADTPNTDFYFTLKESVEKGLLKEEVLDSLARRVLNQKYELGLFDDPYVDEEKAEEIFKDNKGREISKELYEKSMVLLKNRNGILPLKDDYRKIGLIGPFAARIKALFGGYAYPSHLQNLFSAVYNYSNTMVGGFGDFYRQYMDLESLYDDFGIDPELSYEDNIDKYLRNRFGFKSLYDNFKEVFTDSEIETAVGFEHYDSYEEDLKEAVDLAKKQDVLVLCLGEVTGFGKDATSGEGVNNTDLTLPGKQEELVKELKKLGKPMILVLINGRGMEITDINDDFDAILEAYYPGDLGAEAVARILHGDINPSGKLSITFPRHSSQCPAYYGFHAGSGYYSVAPKGFFDGFNKTQAPLYCFGHGLSYSTFEYSDLNIREQFNIDDKITVSFRVKNTGKVKGTEIPFVFFRTMTPSVNRPVKELRGFNRVELQPGEEKTVEIIINTHSLGYYDADNDFVIEPAEYQVYVGAASDDIRLTGGFKIVGEKKIILHDRTFLFESKIL